MFEPGQVYNRRRDLHARYGGQQQGGIITPAHRSYIFLVTGEEGDAFGYRDEFKEDGVFWYTGEGQRGDMRMLKGNLSIRDHEAHGKTLHLFEKISRKGDLRYVGEFSCLGYHEEIRPDVESMPRIALVFELASVPQPGRRLISDSAAERRELHRLRRLPLDELRELARGPSKESPDKVQRLQVVRVRSEAVRQYALTRAGGICESCEADAPFKSINGGPFLEVHHLNRLADGGPDEPGGVAAICPNCHRRIHHGADGTQLNEQLKERVRQKESQLLKEGPYAN